MKREILYNVFYKYRGEAKRGHLFLWKLLQYMK
jgi:hypothetical protein